MIFNVGGESGSLKYNQETDYLQVCCNGVWENVLYCGLQAHALIPTMVNNSSPSGLAASSSVYGSNYAYYAFDNDAATRWRSEHELAGEYLCYTFPTNVSITRAKIKFDDHSVSSDDVWYLQAYVDGAWVNIATISAETLDLTEYTFNSVTTNKIRLYLASTGAEGYHGVYTFQVYGTEVI